jgi:CheY-like chemotaxis protein
MNPVPHTPPVPVSQRHPVARILVIDDDVSVRGYTRRVLALAGHSVEEVGDGKATLAALRMTAPDLIVCDLFMPGQEGIETIRALRWLAPTLPIIAISGGGRWGMAETLREAVALGANVGLAKPFSPGDLIQAVNALLEVRPEPEHRPAPAPVETVGAITAAF